MANSGNSNLHHESRYPYWVIKARLSNVYLFKYMDGPCGTYLTSYVAPNMERTCNICTIIGSAFWVLMCIALVYNFYQILCYESVLNKISLWQLGNIAQTLFEFSKSEPLLQTRKNLILSKYKKIYLGKISDASKKFFFQDRR